MSSNNAPHQINKNTVLPVSIVIGIAILAWTTASSAERVQQTVIGNGAKIEELSTQVEAMRAEYAAESGRRVRQEVETDMRISALERYHSN